jgi:anti-sigma B factor antagonist
MDVGFESVADGVIVLSVSGDVDAFSAPELKEQLFACLDGGTERLIIDMTGSDFIDSTGLGVLVAGVKHARGRELSIVCDSGSIRHILGIVGLDRVFALYHTRSDAMRTVAGSGCAPL